MINAPDLDDNSDIFSALYRLVCARAQETRLPIEVILCQVIYHVLVKYFRTPVTVIKPPAAP